MLMGVKANEYFRILNNPKQFVKVLKQKAIKKGILK